MGFISCGMQCRVQHCSTHYKPGSEAAVEQLSQQVMIASSTIPLESCDEYSTPADSQDPQNVQEILCEVTVNDEDEDIVISEKLARAIKWEGEFAFVGRTYLFGRIYRSNLRRRSDDHALLYVW